MLPSIFHRVTASQAYKRLTPIIKDKKSASYFTITLTLLSLSFFGLFAIRPTLITAVTLNKSVADLKKLSIDYENKISNVIIAQSEYEKIRNDLPLLYAALPADAAFHQLANTLERYADQSNVTIKQLQIDKAPISLLPPAGKILEIGFSIQASGDYSSTSIYLQHLLNWKRIITISEIDLAKEGSTESASLRLSIKGKTYYEP